MLWFYAFFGCWGIYLTLATLQKEGVKDFMSLMTSFVTVTFWIGFFTTK